LFFVIVYLENRWVSWPKYTFTTEILMIRGTYWVWNLLRYTQQWND